MTNALLLGDSVQGATRSLGEAGTVTPRINAKDTVNLAVNWGKKQTKPKCPNALGK